MQTNDIAKLNKMLKAIKVNFPKIKIDFCVFSSGEVVTCINKNCLIFENVRKFVRELNFLNSAKFTPSALKACLKKKNLKKKNIFFYWLLTCVKYTKNKGRTLEDLRHEFNELYHVEMKQGRKKRPREETKGTAPTECTE